MKVAAGILVALVIGAAVGVGIAFTVQDSAGESGAVPVTTDPTTAPPVEVKPLPEVPAAPVADALFLAWTARGLPPDLGQRLAGSGHVEHVTTVRRDAVDLIRSTDADGTVVDDPTEGFVVPIDAIAVDPASYAGVVPAAHRAAFDDLGADEALLGRTSAALRRVGVGGTLTFDGGARFVVTAIVDDELIGGAEVAVTYDGGAAIGVGQPRYVLFTSRAERASLEDAVRVAAPADKAMRLRQAGETPFLRNGDAVLPQVMIKERFGEFTYRPRAGDDIEPDAAWVAENIVTARVPLLGEVRCHRALIPALRAALGEIERENLGHLVAPDGYLGCFVPRTTRYDEQLSRHSWGVALDLNYPKNPTGQRSVQDDRLVEILQDWGFTWGGEWLVPDPAHFEYVRPPTGD